MACSRAVAKDPEMRGYNYRVSTSPEVYLILAFWLKSTRRTDTKFRIACYNNYYLVPTRLLAVASAEYVVTTAIDAGPAAKLTYVTTSYP